MELSPPDRTSLAELELSADDRRHIAELVDEASGTHLAVDGGPCPACARVREALGEPGPARASPRLPWRIEPL